MKFLWLRLRLWLGWDKKARRARKQIDLIQWTSEIQKKAAAYDARVRAATISSGIGRECGDMVVLHTKHIPTGGRLATHAKGQEVLNIMPPVPKGVPLLLTAQGLEVVELGDNAEELLAAWKLGESVETIRNRILDRTDTASDTELPDLDWYVEVSD